MATHRADRVTYEFDNAGVKVRVPRQTDERDNDVIVQRDDETAEDYSPKRGPDDIQMAYWYGGTWILFGAKNKYHVTGTGPDDPGSAIAEISVWGDPPIAIR